MAEHLISIFVTATFVENMALAFFLGMCSFLACSRKVEVAAGRLEPLEPPPLLGRHPALGLADLHPQHVAVGAEDHLVAGRQAKRHVEAADREHADRRDVEGADQREAEIRKSTA